MEAEHGSEAPMLTGNPVPFQADNDTAEALDGMENKYEVQTTHVDNETLDTMQKRRGRPKLLKKYLKEWEDEDRFKEWIREVPGDSSIAFCRYCMATIRANVKDLENHATFKKHKLSYKRQLEYYTTERMRSECNVDAQMSSYSKMVKNNMELLNDEDKENVNAEITETSDINLHETKNVALHTKVKYKRKWETMPEFMDWICADSDSPDSAMCRYCNVSLPADNKDLLQHTQSTLHRSNIPTGNNAVVSGRGVAKKDKDFVYEDDEQYNYVDPNPYIPQADESMILERNELEFEVLNIKRNVVQLQKQKLQLEIKKLEIELNKMQEEMKIPVKPGGTLRGVRRAKPAPRKAMKVVPQVSALPDVTKVSTVLPAITTAFTSAQLQGNSERTIQIITHADLEPVVTSASQDFTGLPTVSAPVAIPVSYEGGESVVTVSYEPSAETTYTYTAGELQTQTPTYTASNSDEPVPMPSNLSMPSLSPWHDYSNSTGPTIIS